jgi:hypothetical protein
MPERPIEVHGSLPADLLQDIARTVERHAALDDVLAWARAADPARDFDQVVTQDEFTHDVVVRYDSTAYLVYDAT